jgi:hypothetical protein
MSKSGRGWVREYTSGQAAGVSFTTTDVAGLPAALPNWFELPSGGTLVGVDADGTAVTLSSLPANQRYEVTLRSITTCTGTIRIGYSEEAQTSTGVAGPAGPDFTVTASKTGAYTAAAGELVQVDTTGGAVTVTLPTAVGIAGQRIRVQDDAGTAATNAITVATTSSQTVNGSTTIAKLAVPWEGRTFVSDGANWLAEAPKNAGVSVTASKTGAYTARAGDYVRVDTTSGGVTITLPTAVGVAGQSIEIKDAAGTAATNAIVLATTSSQTVDGLSTPQVIESTYGSRKYVSDGANWLSQGGIDHGRVSVTAAKTGTAYVARAGEVVLVNSAADTTITLPTAVGIKGQRIAIKDTVDASVHNITVATTSSQTVDATTPAAITTAKGSKTYLSDGANWWLV